MNNDYIRKEDAIDAATQDSTENRTHSFRAGQARSASRIKALEPADVIQVVRCKECKFRENDDFCTGRGFPYQLVPDDGFCDKGERKE